MSPPIMGKGRKPPTSKELVEQMDELVNKMRFTLEELRRKFEEEEPDGEPKQKV